MSKASKSAAKVKRAKAKAAKKAAQKALYLSYAQSGDNSKRARIHKAKGRKDRLKSTSHPTGRCFNYHCNKCTPQNANLKGAGLQDVFLKWNSMIGTKPLDELIKNWWPSSFALKE